MQAFFNVLFKTGKEAKWKVRTTEPERKNLKNRSPRSQKKYKLKTFKTQGVRGEQRKREHGEAAAYVYLITSANFLCVSEKAQGHKEREKS